jgi:hypothetical protein
VTVRTLVVLVGRALRRRQNTHRCFMDWPSRACDGLARRSVAAAHDNPPGVRTARGRADGPYAMEARHEPATSAAFTLSNTNGVHRPGCCKDTMQISTHTRCNPCAHISPKRAGRPPLLSFRPDRPRDGPQDTVTRSSTTHPHNKYDSPRSATSQSCDRNW